ncbi:MAG: phosphoribosylamine--glycine ligase [Deltaproteobacteria bacterium]|nr:phosphoribosylamine--glycine ligase [Deltaproteobacteria bacterium]
MARVLVVGGGGREHALSSLISESPGVDEVLCAPGNAGIAAVARCLPVGADEEDGILDAARSSRADLVVVGPEAPLCAGLADRLRAAGVPTFGPSALAARLEGSKSWAKELMRKSGIPTAPFSVHTDLPSVERALRSRAPGPVVVKADGLAAGKGVRVCDDVDEAILAARELMSGAFGEAGRTLLVEDRLFGEEVSFHVLCDGERVLPLDPAQDHKRLEDGDRGPNTGGMGAYAPAPVVDAAMRARILREIAEPTVRAMRDERAPFTGALFIGLMIVDGRPMVLEYNVRFGDPETQALVMRLEGDFAGALRASAQGDLSRTDLRVRPGAALCVVLAAEGYPATVRRGDPIEGLDRAAAMEDVAVFHAGTKRDREGRVVTAGGRVLGVAARGSCVTDAAERAYRAAGEIRFTGKRARSDIGRRAIDRERAR